MNKILKKLYADRKALVEQMETLSANEDMSDEDYTKFDELKADIADIDRKIGVQETILKAKEYEPAKIPNPVKPEAANPAFDEPKLITIPAQCKRWTPSKFKSYQGDAFKSQDKEMLVYKAGMFLRAVIAKSPYAVQWCDDHGMGMSAALNENTNVSGGYLVFDQLDRAIIDLRNDYGLFRQAARLTPMMSDVLIRPRKTGRVSATFVGEGEQITESETTWDQVKLIAKKLAVITAITNELNSDAIISITDDLIDDISLAFATKEDESGFKGDGTSTYGGITGCKTRLTDINGVDDGGGLVLGAGNLFSELTLANHQDVISILPLYAKRGAEWYCSNTYYESVMNKLAMAAGGTQPFQIIDGQRREMFLGYPVNLTESMPTSDANSQVCVIFGNMPQAAMFGDRAGTTIAFSTDATVGSNKTFEQDMMAVRGIERFDINVHDVGTATVAGPIVGLITAAS
jgi:HK97 family phage major capsid protein